MRLPFRRHSISSRIATLAQLLIDRQQKLAVAESCTGGWLAKVCTDLSGSSIWFECGFVSYSNEAKQAMLGVPETIIAEFGAVSEQTVIAMAKGALKHSRAHWALAISGVAGPGGGSDINPVGSVWFGCTNRSQHLHTSKKQFCGDRQAVRQQSVDYALKKLIKLLK